MFRRRLEIRVQNLEEQIKQVEGRDIITEEDLITSKISLKHAVTALEKDLHTYIQQSSEEPQDYEPFLQVQLRGENSLIKLETAHEIFKRSQSQSAHTKLPKLDLFKFDGQAINWQEFYDKFEVTIHNKNLKDVEKLTYLLSCLQGPALETVSGLTINNDNYSIALEALKKRFGSKERLVDAHYRALNNLERASDNFESCRQTLDHIEKNLRILQTLGENVDGNHLRFIITSKFPDNILYQVSLMAEDQSVSSLRANLNKVILAKENTTTSCIKFKTDDNNAVICTTEALHTKTEERPRNLKRKKQFTLNTTNKKPRLPCIFCKLNNHTSGDCKKFKSIEQRKEKLKGRCLNCLRRNHRTEACRKKISCYRCKENHLQLFCPNEGKGKESSYDPKVMKGNETETMYSKVKKKSCDHTFLQTAVAEILDPMTSNTRKVRVLMDSGSQRSYITGKLAKTLELTNRNEEVLLVYTFGATAPQETKSPSVDVIIKTKRDITKKIRVNIVPHITEKVPIAKYNTPDIDVLADDDTTGEGIDVLIGNNFYCSFLRNNKIVIAPNLFLIDTDFGWILSGYTAQGETNVLSVMTYCQCHIPSCPYFTEPDLPLRNIDIEFLWSLESIGITDSPKVTRQEEAVRHFNETVLYKEGRYEVKWPWIQYPPELPSNFGLAFGRLKSLTRRLNQESLLEYESILKEQLELGIVEEVTEPHGEVQHPVHYLPHHMVQQKGKRGRLVYDASAKTTGNKSLNENLYSGPSMLEDLTALLLQFRLKRIGIIADVEKAFLQVGLQMEDRDVTRFLWLKDSKREVTEENLKYLRFCRVPFGVISSPFLLTATIRYHMSQADNNLLKSIADKCYVDNLVTTASSVDEARQIYDQTRATFNQLGMNIRDWISNEKKFMDVIPSEHKASQTENVKVLGLQWNTKDDSLKLKTSDNHTALNTPQTKREVLRSLARVYDPCGFVCPLILPMKITFQNICEKKIKWDSKLSEDLKETLNSSLIFLKAANEIKLPRYVGIQSEEHPIYELHCFTDASKNAYAAVVYLKTQGKQESAVHLLMAKSRISQIKDKENLKIPKQELLGFLIGSRLLKYVKLNSDLPILKEYLWTDSLVVLGWMNSNKLLPPFVANRVNEIKRNHQQTEMCYINTKLNPADVATRPELWDQKKELWFNGPDFLKKDKSCWPLNRHYMSHQTLFSVGEALEESPGEIGQGVDTTQQGALCDDTTGDIEPESHVQEGEVDTLHETTSEIKKLQEINFPEELARKQTHLSRNLDLFLDVDGLLRCRGRMSNTTWSYDMKYPVLLPKNNEFTDKVIKKTHEDNYHVGASHTLSIIRQKYWIPQGKAQVIKALRRCTQCVKHGGGPYKLPITPALPPERVNYYHPFSFTGVDYFGPLYVNTLNGKEKRWVALFTCLSIRAIHLEIVKDLSAEECLLAIRRFIATRGIPKRMYSDNATCFKLTAEVMSKPYCIEKEMQWKFIPQLAPWHGGFYERLVALVKHCLKRTLDKHLLPDSKMLTLMKEVEAVVNSRPLTQVGSEIVHILRPADFLSFGKCLTAKPVPSEIPCTGTTAKTELIKGWKNGLMILEEFKKMFIGQYLVTLRERSKNSPKQPRIKSNRAPQIGDLVQIKSDEKNRIKWKTGKIVSLIQGLDGEHRVAKVQTEDSVLTRSIGHLYPLEIDEEFHQNDYTVPETPVLDPEQNVTLPNPTADTGPDNMDIDSTSFNSYREIDTDIRDSIYQFEECDVQPQQSMNSSPVVIPNQSVESSRIEDVPEAFQCQDNAQNKSNDDITIDDPQRGDEVEVRGRRDAAIRAREKLREWTRHLLTLLK